MQYLGGKKRLAKHIASVLESHRSDGQRFVDVFCGSLAITAAMSDRGPRVANDGCKPLIVLYEAWREGWRPPPITEDLYREVKAKQDPDDPLTAFVGFGCSFGGKWFGGYARARVMPGTNNKQSPANGGTERADFSGPATRSLDRLLAATVGVTFTSLDFSTVHVQPGDLVYADPEYRGTTKYNFFKTFDYAGFVRTAQRWADSGVSVIVSEYAASSETWELVAEWTNNKNIAKAPRVERLYRVRPISTASATGTLH